MRQFEFANSQEAWEKLNEFFFNEEAQITQDGGGRYGNQLVSYDNHVVIRKAWVDPKFDFGNVFGYRPQKWSGLISNYVNMNYLDILKSQIVEKESKPYPQYNLSMPFDNSHGHGKNCLLSLTCCRRLNTDVPVIIFNLRSSEITKRLLIDFLLVQRIAEYIYGEKQTVILHMFCGNMYQNVEAFTMYDLVKPLKKINTNKKGESKWTDTIMQTLDKFKSTNPDEIKYKVFKRSANQLQKVHGDRPMIAGELFLKKKDIEYPEDCITLSQRRAYKRKINKNGNKQTN
jgi:hypothetical protein